MNPGDKVTYKDRHGVVLETRESDLTDWVKVRVRGALNPVQWWPIRDTRSEA